LHFQRGVDKRQREHRVRDHGSGNPARHLRGHVERRVAQRQFALQRKYQRNRRIEMRARDGTENADENHQDRAGGQGIAE
jgi:hypothetical protein